MAHLDAMIVPRLHFQLFPQMPFTPLCLEKSDLLMDVFVCLRLSSRHRQSSVSVVFDFSDSLNDFAPMAPISLSVDVMRKDKDELLMDVFCVSFFCLHE